MQHFHSSTRIPWGTPHGVIRQTDPWRMTALAVPLAALTFAVDLQIPLGVAGGVPYVAVVLLGWWFPRRRHIAYLATVSSALTVAGFYLSPEDGGIPWMVLSNRFLALLAIWATAILLNMAKAATEQLNLAHDELEARVEERTRQLARRVEEHERVQAERNRALETAEKASKAKSEFLATMSHELRTPLNAIFGFAEIIGGEYFGPAGDRKYREYAEDIQASSRHLLDLINDVLDLSAIEAGRFPLVREKIEIAALVDECSRTIADAAERKHIAYSVEIPPDLPPCYADRRGMKQILLNLLSNAVKFTPAGGRIALSVAAADGRHSIEVADSGEGIPAEKLARLTDPFTRAEPDPHKSQDGAGLGLSIVDSLLKLHGGELVVKSDPRKGTTVTATLPSARQ